MHGPPEFGGQETDRLRPPSGEPPKDFCPPMSGKAASWIGSETIPTVMKRPFGARAPMYSFQSSVAFTVERMKLREPAIFFSCSLSRVLTVLWAPNLSASSRLESLEVKAVTSHPHLLRKASARWPKPPIPITPTRSVGWTLFWTMGLKTVIPPQKSGPAFL